MTWVCRACGWMVPDSAEGAHLALRHADAGHEAVERIAVECDRCTAPAVTQVRCWRGCLHGQCATCATWTAGEAGTSDVEPTPRRRQRRDDESLCDWADFPHELDATGWCPVCETQPQPVMPARNEATR